MLGMLFGAKLRHLRRKRSLTQAQLAAQLAIISRPQVANLERGLRAPALNVVLRVAGVFGVSTDYLLNDDVLVDSGNVDSLSQGSGDMKASHEDATAHAVPGIDAYQLLGDKLKYLRVRDRLTQAEVARRLALSTHSSISHLESGRKEPSLDLLLRAAELFDVSVDYLLRDDIPVDTHDMYKPEPSNRV